MVAPRPALAITLAAAVVVGCGPTAERTLDFRFGAGNHVVVLDRTGWFVRVEIPADRERVELETTSSIRVSNPFSETYLRVTWQGDAGRSAPTIVLEPANDRLRLTVYLGSRMTNEQRYRFGGAQWDLVFDRPVLAMNVDVSLVQAAYVPGAG